MKTSAQKAILNAFERSSEQNDIILFSEKMQQANRSGASYRSQKDTEKRVKMASRFEDDLMRPYQDTYRNQIPAILLAVADKNALDKVILRKMRLAENEQRLSRYLLESKSKGEVWLMQKWATFKEDMDEEEVAYYEKWLETFNSKEDNN